MDVYTTSTIIRHPVDRLLSFWRHTTANGDISFEMWM
ncbi:MAG: sulfotransferase family 2 domain-containing protein, partial [Deltaproteobacteria bacterium]|nr:sulfotransferase family 2 domain-containing protein [Deltaproteobacteria bacterium]